MSFILAMSGMSGTRHWISFYRTPPRKIESFDNEIDIHFRVRFQSFGVHLIHLSHLSCLTRMGLGQPRTPDEDSQTKFLRSGSSDVLRQLCFFHAVFNHACVSLFFWTHGSGRKHMKDQKGDKYDHQGRSVLILIPSRVQSSLCH
jgi:hypothetical protein